MSDLDILNNPGIVAAAEREKRMDQIKGSLATQLLATKTWEEMRKVEREVCLRLLVSEVETEAELRNQLSEVIVDEYFDLNWEDTDPDDVRAMEAQLLVRALGGLVAKNGALVMIITAGDIF